MIKLELVFQAHYSYTCFTCGENLGAKLLSDLVTFLIFPSDIPLDFYELISVVSLKYLKSH